MVYDYSYGLVITTLNLQVGSSQESPRFPLKGVLSREDSDVSGLDVVGCVLFIETCKG